MSKKVILINVPWTFPPFKVNGIMISGPPLPGNRALSGFSKSSWISEYNPETGRNVYSENYL